MYAFIHIYKTAGTTLTLMLRSTFGLRHACVEPWDLTQQCSPPWIRPFTAGDLQRVQRVHPRLVSISGHCVKPYADLETVCPDVQYFTLLRDPLKQSASQFQSQARQGGKLAFEEWIQQEGIGNRQVTMLAGKADVDEAIRLIRTKNVFVGIVERFDESMLLLKHLVISDLSLGYERANVHPDNTIARELLTSERTRQMLTEANQLDFELYDYVQKELYLAYCEEYGDRLRQDVADYSQKHGTFNWRNVYLNRVYRFLIGKPISRLYRSFSARQS